MPSHPARAQGKANCDCSCHKSTHRCALGYSRSKNPRTGQLECRVTWICGAPFPPGFPVTKPCCANREGQAGSQGRGAGGMGRGRGGTGPRGGGLGGGAQSPSGQQPPVGRATGPAQRRPPTGPAQRQGSSTPVRRRRDPIRCGLRCHCSCHMLHRTVVYHGGRCKCYDARSNTLRPCCPGKAGGMRGPKAAGRQNCRNCRCRSGSPAWNPRTKRCGCRMFQFLRGYPLTWWRPCDATPNQGQAGGTTGPTGQRSPTRGQGQGGTAGQQQGGTKCGNLTCKSNEKCCKNIVGPRTIYKCVPKDEPCRPGTRGFAPSRRRRAASRQRRGPSFGPISPAF